MIDLQFFGRIGYINIKIVWLMGLFSLSEDEKIKRVNEVERRAPQILKGAEVTVQGIRKVAEAFAASGGKDAAYLEVTTLYLAEFGKLAKENNTMIIPGNLYYISGMVTTAKSTFLHVKKGTYGNGDEAEIRFGS